MNDGHFETTSTEPFQIQVRTLKRLQMEVEVVAHNVHQRGDDCLIKSHKNLQRVWIVEEHVAI